MTAPKLKNYMTPLPYSVDIHATLSEARNLMQQHKVRHLPVTHQRNISGIVSDRDIMVILDSVTDTSVSPELTVEDAYIQDCYLVDAEHPLKSVLKYMADHHIGSAVVTSQGRLAGIFTTVDACRAFAEYLD